MAAEENFNAFREFRMEGEDVNIHIKAKVTGDPAKVNLFYAMLAVMDADCPLPQLYDYYHCKACGGDFWKAPALGPQELRALAKQVGGVKIKIKSFSPAHRCPKTSELQVKVNVGEEEGYGYCFG